MGFEFGGNVLYKHIMHNSCLGMENRPSKFDKIEVKQYLVK
jgi:hypothetical protein